MEREGVMSVMGECVMGVEREGVMGVELIKKSL